MGNASSRTALLIRTMVSVAVAVCAIWITVPLAANGAEPTEATQAAVTSGELIIERPTLICLGFEWRIQGDENYNATVSVRYRKRGTAEWREYLPLFRIGKGREVPPGYGNFDDPNHGPLYKIPEGFAGSIMDLTPATTYEVRLELRDPDGVEGETVKELKLTTRAEPKPAVDGEIRHVYPPGWKGDKEEPAYKSIMHAVNGFHPWCDCYQTVHPNRARPGTIVKVHAGTYKSDFTNYRDKLCLWLHGTRTLVADGEPDKPIAIVAAGDGDVIIDCAGADVGFNIMAADYLYFEGLTIRDTRIAFHGGFQGVMGCKGLTLKHCRLEQVQYGVLAQDGRSTDFYIADNVILGRNPADRFNPESGGAWGRTKAGYAVNLAGQGHVVCYNRCENFWDVLNVFTNCLADPALGQQARSIDFYNNDLFNVTDNFIETDGGYANIRVLRNRCFNGMAAPLSVQPVYAGPVYWIRNVLYNAHKGARAFKLEAGINDNVICYHNTLTNHWTNAGGLHFGDVRNNLFMGPADYVTERDRQRGRSVLDIAFQDPSGILDHNAHRVGLPVEKPFVLNGKAFESLAALAAATGREQHGLEILDYDEVFVATEEPEHAPNNEGRLYRPTEVDLRLKADATVVDAACRLPGINDDFTGKAPDIGAFEFGSPIPHYGPRTGEAK